VTTVSDEGEMNLAPMGPMVDEAMTTLVLRPFQTSTTFRNLMQRPEGVFHVTDDVLMLAQAAVGRIDPLPLMVDAEVVSGQVVANACRWYEFRIEEADTSSERSVLTARIVHSGRTRDYFGLHRARHAVLEAAILATRVHLLEVEDIRSQIDQLGIIVEKTAGPTEQRAFDLIRDYVAEAHASPTGCRVQTGARLHLGLVTGGTRSAPCFSGAGLMIDEPGVLLEAEPSGTCEIVSRGPGENRQGQSPSDTDVQRAGAWLEGVVSKLHRACRITLHEVIPRHTGLGSGTQLALAVATAAGAISGQESPASRLAMEVGRGVRSGVGIHGFEQGGFLVDGRTGHTPSSPQCLARCEVPGSWRFVLAGPESGEGMSGQAEREAFGRLSPSPQPVADQLAALLWQKVLPAMAEGLIDAVGEALFEFGTLVGETFADIQGGVFANPQMAELVDWAREAGIRGVGQTSWGPTIWMLVPDDATAHSLCGDVAGRPGVGWAKVVRPLNQGASITRRIGQPPRVFSNNG